MMLQTNYIKTVFLSLCLAVSSISFAQKAETKEIPEHQKEAIQQVFTGNEEMLAGNVLDGEKSYRKAIAKDPNNLEAKYNLGYSYYKTKSFQEATQRNKEAVKNAKTKAEKHIANHNLGNSYLQMGKPDEAIEAYKNALRNNPTDDETRYNLAVAKQAKQQQDQNKDGDGDSKDKKDGEKGDDKKEGEDGDDKKDKDKKEGEDDKKDKGDEGDEEKDEKPEDKKDGDKGDGEDEKDQKPPQPREGKLSPEQAKSLLEAMAQEEKKVQDKMNEKKARGVKVKTDKDW